MKAKFEALVAEYGPVAVGTYVTLTILVYVAFIVAMKLGVEIESAAGTAGVLGGAWVASKVTQPLRFLATFALTPFVARVLRRKQRTAEGSTSS